MITDEFTATLGAAPSPAPAGLEQEQRALNERLQRAQKAVATNDGLTERANRELLQVRICGGIAEGYAREATVDLQQLGA